MKEHMHQLADAILQENIDEGLGDMTYGDAMEIAEFLMKKGYYS